MRLPKLRDLTEAQQDVYLYAPKDKHVLVEGPPGTGKTLIACLRAVELHKRGVPASLGMFNRVLTQYASNVGEGPDGAILVQTVHQWLRDWWNRAALPPCSGGGEICVQVDYEERSAAKAVGAWWDKERWRPWQNRKGTWVVDFDTWAAAPERFASWKLWHAPPQLADAKSQTDWDAIVDHVMSHEESLEEDALSLGTLLIDEGQDFAPGFYRFLQLLAALGSLKQVQFPLRCFVLADENQQLTQYNSKLFDIRTELKIDDARHYRLLDNFRNTHEIAELARSFFADVGVLPRLPERHGEIPSYAICKDMQECVRRIMNWVVNHPGKETGVLVFKEARREELQSILSAVAAKLKGRAIAVQSYSSKSSDQNKVSELVFDKPDVITVLNMQSCKGLEFDSVFVIDLNDAPIGKHGVDRFKMQMFVAVSRARDYVKFLESSCVPNDAPFMKELPSAEVLVRDVEKVSEPSSKIVIESVPTTERHTSGTEDWAAWAKTFARKHDYSYEDLRPAGCFWLYAPESHAKELEARGFKYTARRDGWWRV